MQLIMIMVAKISFDEIRIVCRMTLMIDMLAPSGRGCIQNVSLRLGIAPPLSFVKHSFYIYRF